MWCGCGRIIHAGYKGSGHSDAGEGERKQSQIRANRNSEQAIPDQKPFLISNQNNFVGGGAWNCEPGQRQSEGRARNLHSHSTYFDQAERDCKFLRNVVVHLTLRLMKR
jgi:hypothetical protein